MHYRFIPLLFTSLVLTATATAQTPFSLLYSLNNPDTNGHFGGFGSSVAVDTNFAVVSVAYRGGYTPTASQPPVTVYNPTNGAILYTLANPGQPSYFGSSVAVSGTRVFVGDFDSHPLYSQGSVYIYDLAGVKPTVPVSRLWLWPASPGVVMSLAASGDYLVIRSRFSTYVYDLGKNGPASPGVSFPTSPLGDGLAMSGSRVVVGVYGYDYPPWNTNAATVYVYDVASSTPGVPILALASPTPAEKNFFGRSVAISGDRIVVGMDRGGTNVPGTLGGAAYVYDLASATPSEPVATLSSPNSSWGDYFGYTVGISGTRVVVGAFDDDTGASNSGSAYVYDLGSATPEIPVTALNNPTPATQDQFGQVVAIAGVRVVIGAPGHDLITTNAGSAYLYDVAGAQPAIPVARLDPGPTPAFGEGFGGSVAISGTRVIVSGSPNTRVYDLAGTTPVVPVTTLFGGTVAISGSRAVVGGANTVYVYDLTRSTPEVPMFVLNNPGPAPAYFGSSVGISGTRVAVGAPDAGRAYVYDLASTTPTQPTFTLNNPGTAPGFGRAVAISGARLVIGAFSEYQTNSAAYVYDLTTTPPGVLRLIDPAPSSAEMFGSSVAISGTRVVVGAYMVNWGSTTPGKTHIYNLTNDTPAVAVATLTPQPLSSGFGYSVAISGTRVVVSSVWSQFEDGRGAAFVYDIAGNTPTLPIAILRNPMFAGLDSFARSVAVDGTTVVVGSAEPPANGAAFVFGPEPRLTIAPSSTNSATISWVPANSPEFFLQSANDLAASNWLYAPSHTTNPVSIPVTNQARFYRLFSP